MVLAAGETLGTVEQEMKEAFRAFVGDDAFPCLAGKGAVHRDDVSLGVYGSLGRHRDFERLASDLARFVRGCPADGSGLRTFVAVYPGAAPPDEIAFERRLWKELQRLHEHDDTGSAWDPSVSADPDDAQFSFSFAGSALFVVGLHAASSRLARRFAWPALVFNPRAQFERLRVDGRYDRLRAAVRDRDVALQGSPNPNLADFGERSEARQYSGRATEAEWRCPFHHRAEP